MENRKYRNIPLQQQIYSLAFLVLTIKTMLESTQLWTRPEWLDGLLLCVFFVLMGIKLFMQDYDWKKIALALSLGIPCIITCFHVSYYTMLFSYCLIFGMQYVDLKKVVNQMANFKLLVILLHVVIYLLVYAWNPQMLQFSYRTDDVARHYFFLGHANTFSAYLVWALLEKAYTNYERLKIRHIVLLELINILFYQFTDSNTSMIVGSLCFALLLLQKLKTDYFQRTIQVFARFGYAFFAVFFSLLVMGYTRFRGWMLFLFYFLDELFTGRLAYGAYLYDTFGATMFGQTVYLKGKVYWNGHWFDRLVMDNCFLMFLEIYGWIYMVVIALAFWRMGRKDSGIGILEKIMIVGYIYAAVMENYTTNAVYCFPLLFIGAYIYRKEQAITPREMKDRKIGNEILDVQVIREEYVGKN